MMRGSAVDSGVAGSGSGRDAGGRPLTMPELALSFLLGNCATIIVGFLLYLNYRLFEPYFESILWAVLLSIALRSTKDWIIDVMSRLESREQLLLVGMYHMIARRRKGYYAWVAPSLLVVSLGGLLATPWPWWTLGVACVMFVTLICLVLFILDRRIFWYRYMVDDHTLVTMGLFLAVFCAGIFVTVFISVQIINECVQASNMVLLAATADGASGLAAGLSPLANPENHAWVLSQLPQEQLEVLSALITPQGEIQVEPLLTKIGFNATEWGPVLNPLLHYVYHSSNLSGSSEVVLSLPHHHTLSDAMRGSMDKFSEFDATLLLDWAQHAAIFLFSVSGSVFSAVYLMFYRGFGIVLSFVVFLMSLFYLLVMKQDITYYIGELVPISLPQKEEISGNLRRVISHVFVLPVKLAFAHGLITFVLFGVYNMDFAFLATFFAFAFAALPLIPSYFVSIPWCVHQLLFHQRYVIGISLFAVHYVLLLLATTAIYGQELKKVSPYVTGLSLALGYTVFGIQGVVLGPLLVSICIVIYNAFGMYVSEELTRIVRDRAESLFFTPPGMISKFSTRNKRSRAQFPASALKSAAKSRTMDGTSIVPRRQLSDSDLMHPPAPRAANGNDEGSVQFELASSRGSNSTATPSKGARSSSPPVTPSRSGKSHRNSKGGKASNMRSHSMYNIDDLTHSTT